VTRATGRTAVGWTLGTTVGAAVVTRATGRAAVRGALFGAAVSAAVGTTIVSVASGRAAVRRTFFSIIKHSNTPHHHRDRQQNGRLHNRLPSIVARKTKVENLHTRGTSFELWISRN